MFRPKTAQAPPPTEPAAALERARSLQQEGRQADALAICRDILERQPDHAEALFLSAEIAAASGDSDRALQLYRRVLEARPDHAPACYKRGNLLKDRQQLEAALASYDEAIALDPRYAHAYCNRGFVLERLNRWDAALDSYDHAIAITPGDALAHYNRAAVLRELARPQDAIASYTQAIACKTGYIEAYCNRGILLTELERWDEALSSFARCIEFFPGFAPAHCGRGVVYQKTKQWEAALAGYDRAIELDPGHIDAHCNRGSLLTELKQWSAARASLDRAIALDPECAVAHGSLAVLLAAVGQSDLALTAFDRAIALKPKYAQAFLNRANLLVQMRRFGPAVASYERGIALDPDARFAPGMLRYAKMNLCDWSDLSTDVRRLSSGIEAGLALSPPLPMLALLDSVALHHQAAQIWVREEHPANPRLGAPPRRPRGERIRIGYFSGDFYDHPVAVLMAELVELHDRSRFDVVAFSFGRHPQDDMRRRLEGAFDRFIDVRGRSDQDIALLAREMDVDIAVDLAGHTAGSRTGIFALRAAPLQVNFLGYPGTMGAGYIDYLIGDPTVVPEAHEQHYAEKIVRLPHSYLPNDSRREIAGRSFTRDDLGLPPTGFVFCCFNNNYKIMPDAFGGWMRILARVPHSVLWLSQNNETAAANLRREALARGVDAERLVFAGRMTSPAEHLARHRAADLFLDTWPYNAHATAVDALWAGLPVLTLHGAAFAGRVAASVLKAVGLPELVASSVDHYEELAVRLAENPQFSADIRDKLAHNRLTAPLFDTRRFTSDLETAFTEIMNRYHSGLPPDHIRVAA